MENTASSNQFPLTDWRALDRLKNGSESERRESLSGLFLRYRKPILCFLLRKGYTHERAEDLVQDFFLYSIEHHLFEKAASERGRFRNLMLSALQHYAANAHRKAQARIRAPSGGFVEADAIPAEVDGALGVEHSTPEHLFMRAWAQGLFTQAIRNLKSEFLAGAKQAHYEIFEACIWRPVMEGATPPSHAALGQKFQLTEKEVSNRLITAKRAYERLLREEILRYARDEADVAEEIRELTRLLAGK